MWRNLTPVLAASLVIFSGVVHGLWTDRWSASPEVAEFVARIEHVPSVIGDDWHGTDLELTEQERRAARIDGYCYRRYVNVRNRQSVTMLLVCGRAGPIAVHTPDICFEGAGYKATTQPAPFAVAYGVGDQDAKFHTMRLAKVDAPFPAELRVFWGWSSGGPWKAPDNPRVTFAGRRALYKLYVLREKFDENVSPEDDPCVQFLRELLPELDARLDLTP